MRSNILIVDSNAEELMQLISYMEGEYDLEDVASGEDCLFKASNDCPDLILVDDMILEPNCYELCTALKSDPLTIDVPIILMSDLSASELAGEADSLGTDDFICKPINKDELLEKVATLLAFSNAH